MNKYQSFFYKIYIDFFIHSYFSVKKTPMWNVDGLN